MSIEVNLYPLSFQFHVMRDFPKHNAQMPAGLWGADNYMNFSITNAMRKDMFNFIPNGIYGEDKTILLEKVWPIARLILF